jgi:hypothetical protein
MPVKQLGIKNDSMGMVVKIMSQILNKSEN